MEQQTIPNLEHDLKITEWMRHKVRTSDHYAQNLYAALCNNDFQKQDVWPVLSDETWGCSWRYAGGIIADIRGTGDYLDWYCSGMAGDDLGIRPNGGYVSEGYVTDEIEQDLALLGWKTVAVYASDK